MYLNNKGNLKIAASLEDKEGIIGLKMPFFQFLKWKNFFKLETNVYYTEKQIVKFNNYFIHFYDYDIKLSKGGAQK